MDSLPIVVLEQPGSARDELVAELSSEELLVLDSWEAFRGRDPDGWGIMILGPGLSGNEILEVLEHQARENPPWVILLAREEDGRLALRSLSLGHALSPDRVGKIAGAPEEEGPILDLHWALRVVARARHDLNNPLTSGLAEAQLLLMDEHPPEVKESLETIQEQFRRLRDMVADLSRLRVPRRESDFPA